MMMLFDGYCNKVSPVKLRLQGFFGGVQGCTI